MASIGPTAHYTGEVWARNGLSHPELRTTGGRALRAAADAALLPLRVLGGPDLDGLLLARHRAIDAALEEALADGRVGQVLEIACGLSPRGWRFTERHPQLRYVEADLPAMAARKRAALDRMDRPAGHQAVDIDALAEDGPLSLGAVAAAELDPGTGTAVLTEGLLNYLSPAAVRSLWRGIAAVADLYLADLFVRADAPPVIGRAFSAALAAFVRSPISLHFADADEARRELLAAGFGAAEVARADGSSLVRVVCATA